MFLNYDWDMNPIHPPILMMNTSESEPNYYEKVYDEIIGRDTTQRPTAMAIQHLVLMQ